MEWLTEHFDVLLPIALVLFFLFQKLFVPHEGEAGPPGDGSEAAQEARRIQEEIRRKIIARQQGQAQPQPTGEAAFQGEETPPPAFFPRREVSPPPIRYERESPAPAVETPPPTRRSREPAARRDMQDELRVQKERLREARAAKAEAMRRTSKAGLPKERSAYAYQTQSESDLRAQLLADIATGTSLKRAFLLKEVVDRPIGLRSSPDTYSNWS